jgi:hypothetical protein
MEFAAAYPRDSVHGSLEFILGAHISYSFEGYIDAVTPH